MKKPAEKSRFTTLRVEVSTYSTLNQLRDKKAKSLGVDSISWHSFLSDIAKAAMLKDKEDSKK